EREPICRGPSILHNLLPFLEPLFAVYPKLLFIEDHILRRPPAPHNHEAFETPRSLDELKSRVIESSLPCDCDECNPKLYQISTRISHGIIHSQTDSSHGCSARFFQKQRVTNDPRPGLKLRFHGDYEAMHLVRHHVAWLDKTYLQNSSSNSTSRVQQLKSLLHIWHPHITGADMRHSISTTQLQTLFTHLNDVFFSGSVPAHNKILTNGFSYIPEHQKNCFGTSYFNPIIGTQILLHPSLYRHNNQPDNLDIRGRNRLGTLLHEMCHAFLKAYTCRACPMHDHSVGPRGHGRAWQILAAKIEEVAAKVMGGSVDMGRFPSLLRDMEGHGRLPS
ncbi:hypothetical protein EJ02DRAFT_330215, partial [Clathrospora elynae]